MDELLIKLTLIIHLNLIPMIKVNLSIGICVGNQNIDICKIAIKNYKLYYLVANLKNHAIFRLTKNSENKLKN